MRGLEMLLFILFLLLLIAIVHAKAPKRARATSASAAAPYGKGKRSKRHTNNDVEESDRRTRSRKGKTLGKAKSLKVMRNVILPSRKEPISAKVAKGLKVFAQQSKVVLNQASNSSSKVMKVAQKASRVAKSYFSSDFEALLLRLTSPDDNRPSRDDIERVIATVCTFVRNVDLNSENNPYRVTLRKLWAKISESDPRTQIKALYLLHTLLRHSDPEDSIIFKRLIEKMSKEFCKKTNGYYFRLNTNHYERDDTLKKFVDRYGSYVFRRAKAFTSHFEEMKMISHGMQTEDICAQMAKAFKLLDTLLDCKTPVLEGGEIAVICSELIATDVRQLFHLYHEKLRWLVREEELGDIFEGWSPNEVKALLAQLISYYNDNYGAIQSFLTDAAELLQLYHIKFPSTLLIPSVFENNYKPDRPSPSAHSSSSSSCSGSDSDNDSIKDGSNGPKKAKLKQRLGANQAFKSQKVDLNTDREPTVVDIEDYEGDDFDDDFDDLDHPSMVREIDE